MTSSPVALHLVLNDFRPDYRVLKETVSLAQSGWQATVFAMGGKNRPANETIDGVHVSRMPIRSRALNLGIAGFAIKYFECSCAMVWRGWRMKPDVVHAHDLNALPLGWLVSCLTGAALIYDSHEYWADGNHRRAFPAWGFAPALMIEKLLARRAYRMITVSNGIAKLLQEQLRLPQPPLVVRNLPDHRTAEQFDLRKDLGIPADAFLFLYIGGVTANRGVEALISAFNRMEDRKAWLVFLGASDVRAPDGIVDEAWNRVRFKAPVPPRSVPAWAASADVGIVPIEGNHTSYRLSLPNKLFECIQAGLAVVTSDLPEMSRVLLDYGCGRTFPSGDAPALAAVMSELVSNPGELARFKAAAREAGRQLVWEIEAEKLVALYEPLRPAAEAQRETITPLVKDAEQQAWIESIRRWQDGL